MNFSDSSPPEIDCPQDIVVETDTGLYFATITVPLPTGRGIQIPNCVIQCSSPVPRRVFLCDSLLYLHIPSCLTRTNRIPKEILKLFAAATMNNFQIDMA
jgi:hypothetical protein